VGSGANDPTATLASLSCCGSEADCSLYQSVHLNRYDATLCPGTNMKRLEFIHLPSWRSYARTKQPHRCCFCSDDEAQAAGFRKSYKC